MNLHSLTTSWMHRHPFEGRHLFITVWTKFCLFKHKFYLSNLNSVSIMNTSVRYSAPTDTKHKALIQIGK